MPKDRGQAAPREFRAVEDGDHDGGEPHRSKYTALPVISLCMVVRNEEARLGACLRSVRAAVKEVLVVDTGSRDSTVRIARSFGAKVLRTRWRDDFRLPRELSFRHASGDWILVLDADERVDGRKIQALTGGKADAWRFAQRIPSRAWGLLQAGGKGFSETPVVRLFRNLPSIRCANRVHADVEPWLRKAGKVIRDAPFPILHLQDQSPGAMRRRLGRYLRMNLKQVVEDPGDARARRDLGSLLFSVRRDHRAALRQLDAALRLAPRDAMAHALRGLVLLDAGRREEAAEALRRGRGRDATLLRKLVEA